MFEGLLQRIGQIMQVDSWVDIGFGHGRSHQRKAQHDGGYQKVNLTHDCDVKPRNVIQVQSQGVIKSSPIRVLKMHIKELAMKKILPVLFTLLLAISLGPARADPGRWDNHVGTRARVHISIDNHFVHGRGARHSGFGYHHRHGGHHHGHRPHGQGWGLAPWVAAAAIGTTLYWANHAIPAPATVIVSPPVVIDPARVAYFCQTAQQYYPNVPTCNVPWQLVNY